MLEILQSLKYEQILIIKNVVHNCGSIENIKNVDFDNMRPISMFDYSKELNLSWGIVKQLCFDLISKGLLGMVAGLMITADVKAFAPIEFTYEFLKMLE